ncbi:MULTISPECIES: 3-hydroxylacyl-ACP dehydratase [Acidithiobacillus]|nr:MULTISPECIES: 3-hydroxylacyl-ACP dehydratase [Acidithiobacillus]MDA8153659.1 3-hydroxylacyl-ACP dehydratase [Acidithiobacillus sp.]MEB8488497.1 3-hydroxylacyl-ACP dehydratase [Acidithiobacillus ferriphilus]MEB8491307.1 3-hydroxylacyl-ACP dehydratase [Acidithiobacillus ferriphilus]MEB8491640.1 3-hydroxylacyl-ACP dehydratase [Acidithiobacillus ferriphilus]MEB8515485.1 3-hydroxylacyl-ACP dehydratase [Acidithiobacillus ferriphilus]
MSIGRQWISDHIPHKGNMLLLDCVERWDDEQILCVASSHRSTSNPLRAGGRLGAICGVEYAAQAMAVHDALVRTKEGGEPQRSGAGYLASVRELCMEITRLDDIEGDLAVSATRLAAHSSLLYSFVISTDRRMLVKGRIIIFVAAQQEVP